MVVRAVTASGTVTNAISTASPAVTPTVLGSVFRVSIEVTVTVATTMSMSVTVNYKDTGDNARTDTIALQGPTGLSPTNALIIAVGRYTGSLIIGTSATSLFAITIATAGTVTTTTYTFKTVTEELQVGL